MRETWLVAAYWGPRAEVLEDAADRLTRCFAALGAASPLLTRWYQQADTTAEANEPLPTSGQELRDVLLAGQQRTDVGGHLMPGLGYTISGWNGGKTTFEASIGVTSPRVGNNAIVRFRPDDAAALDASGLTEALAALVNAFDPDWATARARPHARAQEGFPHFGWLTYLRGPARIDGATLLANGHLYAATSTPQDATAEAVLAVRAAVNGA